VTTLLAYLAGIACALATEVALSARDWLALQRRPWTTRELVAISEHTATREPRTVVCLRCGMPNPGAGQWCPECSRVMTATSPASVEGPSNVVALDVYRRRRA
jgi:hypothetical protein